MRIHHTGQWSIVTLCQTSLQLSNYHARSKLGRQEAEQGDEHVKEQGEDQPEKHSIQVVDSFSEFIQKKMNQLRTLIDTQFGLLEPLISNDVLTCDQVTVVRQKASYRDEAARKLLEEISKDPMSNEKKKEHFFNALDQTQQKHVSNYIRGNGQHVVVTKSGQHGGKTYKN